MALTKLKNILIDLGMSETEARVYMAMVELGSASVQNVAKRAGISRTAAYDIIGALHEKGIVSTFQKGKKTLFSAEDPSKVKAYFETHLQNMKGQLDDLKRLIPELRILQAEDRPVVRFFTGNDGIRAAFRDVEELRPPELLEVSNAVIVYERMDIKLVHELRELPYFKKMRLRNISTEDGRGFKGKPKQNAILRYLPKKLSGFEGNLWIYKNRISFVNIVGEPEVVIIESQVFADILRAMFEAAWLVAIP